MLSFFENVTRKKQMYTFTGASACLALPNKLSPLYPYYTTPKIAIANLQKLLKAYQDDAVALKVKISEIMECIRSDNNRAKRLDSENQSLSIFPLSFFFGKRIKDNKSRITKLNKFVDAEHIRSKSLLDVAIMTDQAIAAIEFLIARLEPVAKAEIRTIGFSDDLIANSVAALNNNYNRKNDYEVKLAAINVAYCTGRISGHYHTAPYHYIIENLDLINKTNIVNNAILKP